MRRDERIASGGSGGFLDPPTYPTHTLHIMTDLRRKPENRGWVALTSAAEYDWTDAGVRAEAKRILDEWDRPSLDSPEIGDWIAQVLGYFRRCYRGPEGWNAADLTIDDRDPMTSIDTHAGVHLIRKFYPEYDPSPADFAGAYWGQKSSV